MNEIHQTHSGSGDIIGGDKIVYNFRKSKEYSELEKRIADIDELLTALPEDKIDLRYKYAEERNSLIQQKEQFKKEVLALAETFDKIELNTERLKKAKEYFDNGQFKEADAILNTEELLSDLNQILEEEKHLKEKSGKLEESRTQIANEYLVKANLTSLQFGLPNRFEIAAEYFEKSMLAKEMFDNVYAYGMYRQSQREYEKALKLFEKCLNITNEESNLARIHYGIGMTYQYENEAKLAAENYEKAIKIYERISAKDPAAFETEMATLLNNMGLICQSKNDCPSSEKYFLRAIKILDNTAEVDPKKYKFLMATFLNNLGFLYRSENKLESSLEKHSEALKIYEALSKEEPAIYESSVALVLNNLAFDYQSNNDFQTAEINFIKALEIYERLVKDNPKAFEPDYGRTLNNLALLYHYKDLSLAKENYSKAIEIQERLVKYNPQAYEYELANSYCNLGNLYQNYEEPRLSEKYLNKSLDIFERLVKMNPETFEPGFANVLNITGLLYHSLNRFDEASWYYNKSIEIQERIAVINPQSFEINLGLTLMNYGILLSENAESEIGAEKIARAVSIAHKYPELPLSEVILSQIDSGDINSDKNKSIE